MNKIKKYWEAMPMGKIMSILALFIVLMISVSLVFAHGEEDFSKAEDIINAKTPCSQLTDEQLEIIGDYYMEQMHPGEAHEVMDEMMGGEGSVSLKEIHINIARSFYCGEHEALESGMMDIVMRRSNMMGSSYFQNSGGMMNMFGGSYGMMDGTTFGWFGMSLVWLLYIAIAAFVFGIIFWLTYKLIIDDKRKRK